MKTKNKAYMVDGDFVYHPDGSMVEWCQYKNCNNTALAHNLRCEKHLGVYDKPADTLARRMELFIKNLAERNDATNLEEVNKQIKDIQKEMRDIDEKIRELYSERDRLGDLRTSLVIEAAQVSVTE